MLKATIIVGALLVSTAAFSQEVTMRGCVTGAPEGCLVLKSPHGSYTLYVVPPRPAPGRGITATGTISHFPDFCMMGPGLKVAKWHYNRMRCPR